MFMSCIEKMLRTQSYKGQTRVLCHRIIRCVHVIDTVCGVGLLLDGGPDR